MQAPASLKINKYTVDVDVHTVRGEVLSIQVYLAEEVHEQGTHERLQDVFQARPFIPVRREGRVEMLSVAHVCWFRIDPIGGFDELDPEIEAESGSVNAPVRLELDDGTSVEGAFRYFMPPGRRRLVDYLSELPRWVTLRTPEWLYLVSRDRILRVIPTEGASS